MEVANTSLFHVAGATVQNKNDWSCRSVLFNPNMNDSNSRLILKMEKISHLSYVKLQTLLKICLIRRILLGVTFWNKAGGTYTCDSFGSAQNTSSLELILLQGDNNLVQFA